VKDHWPLSVTLLFFAYLVGSFLRAIPVTMADRICGWVFKWTAGKGYGQVLYEGDFPYRSMLDQQLDALQKNGLLQYDSLPVEGTEHTVFNLVLRTAIPSPVWLGEFSRFF
jgi:hypothetical protein